MKPAGNLSSAARLAAGLAAGIGAVVLAGWILNLPRLCSLGLPSRPMYPVSALCFLLSGAAVWIHGGKPGRVGRVLAFAVALAVVVLAADGILDTILHVDTGGSERVSNVIRDSRMPPEPVPPQPTALNTTVPFLLAGLGILSLARARSSGFGAACWLGLAVFSFALHVAVTYPLVSEGRAVSMAPVSALAFLLLGSGLALTRLDSDLALVSQRDSPIGFIVRRFLLVGVLVPPVLFALQSWWLASHGDALQDRSVFFAAVYAMAFLGLLVFSLRRMDKLDRGRSDAELARNEMLARIQEQAANLQFEVSERTFELKESGERLDLAIRSFDCGVWDCDVTTGRTYWNERQCRIYGITPEQFDGRMGTWAKFIHPDDRAQVEAAMERAYKAAKYYRNAYRIVTPGGAVRYIEAHGLIRLNEKGECIRIVGIDRDVTDVHEAERARASLAERLQFALGAAGYGVWENDFNTGRLSWDDRMLEIYGVRPEEFDGTPEAWRRTVHPDDLPGTGKASADVRSGRSSIYEDRFRIIRPDGTVRHIEARGFLQRGADGSPARVIGLDHDVTEEKELREKLRIAEERWQLALSGNNDGLWDWNVVTGEVYFDDRWEEMLGYLPGEVPQLFSEWERRVHPDDLAVAKGAIEMHFAGRTPFYLSEHRLRHKQGHWMWILDRGKIVSRDRQGQPLRMVGTHTDITASKLLEERLRHVEEMALQMSRLAQIGPWDLDLNTDKLTWSPEVYRIHGADLGFEPTFEGMLAFYQGDARASLTEAFDGAIRSGSPFDLEIQVTTAQKRSRWVRFLGKAESKGGETSRIYGAVQDITDVRDSEATRRRLEAQLFQAQKMDTLGTLAGGIAHDFNNLLTGILGYQELALDGLAEDHPSRYCLDSARGVSMRARELVEQILTFSREPEDEMATVDLAYVIEDARRFLKATLMANVAIEAEIAPNCGRVQAEATQIHQVLLNLGQNAAHAIGPAGGTIQIRLEPVDLGKDQASALGILVPGPHLRLTVSDDGHGMDAATQKRIFDPFFTTKSVGKGTGLGLSVVHGIVRAHHGAITVESSPGNGASFSIYLRCSESVEDNLADSEAPAPRGSGELVCIVDDEDFVLSYVRKAMDKLGYRAAAFDSPVRCLEALRGEHSKCSLLITDQTMPEMTGIEMAEQARSFAPELPVIIMSGYFSKVSPETLERMDQVTLVSKPFTTDELARAVRRALQPVA